MTDIVLMAVIGAIVIAAARYVIKAKRRGAKCIGCPEGCCPHKAGETSHCCSCCEKEG